MTGHFFGPSREDWVSNKLLPAIRQCCVLSWLKGWIALVWFLQGMKNRGFVRPHITLNVTIALMGSSQLKVVIGVTVASYALLPVSLHTVYNHILSVNPWDGCT